MQEGQGSLPLVKCVCLEELKFWLFCLFLFNGVIFLLRISLTRVVENGWFGGSTAECPRAC